MFKISDNYSYKYNYLFLKREDHSLSQAWTCEWIMYSFALWVVAEMVCSLCNQALDIIFNGLRSYSIDDLG